MMRRQLVPMACLIAVLGFAVAGEAPPAEKAGMKKPAKASKMQAQFDRFKALAGDWVIAGGDGSVASSFKVTAAGSAVVETMFPGTDHEMVSVYTLDGDTMLMTHYCAAGNAPSMKAVPRGQPNEVRFAFSGATNLGSRNEGHMHDATFWFVDGDHIKSEWVYFADGKRKGEEKFDLTRKK